MAQLRFSLPQLGQHLQKGLAPFYLLHGPEPFLIEESATLIRQHHAALHELDIVAISLEQSSQWDGFLQRLHNRSLFSEQLFFEVKLPSKFTAHDNEKLLQLLQNPQPDMTLLLKGQSLGKAQSQAWFHLLDKHGVIISHYPLTPPLFNQWLQARAKTAGLILSPQATTLLNYHTESNYLAAAQEIERLALFYGGTNQAPVTISHLDEQSQFDVFDLSEALLTQNANRVIKIMQVLKNSQATILSLVIWALAQMLRALLACSAETLPENKRQRLQQAGIRTAQQPLYLKAANDHQRATLAELLTRLSLVDKWMKSGHSAAAWRQALDICLFLCRVKSLANT